MTGPILLLYRLTILLLSPFIAVWFLVSLARGRETREGLSQRLGFAGQRRVNAPVIWLHGASLGELTAARAFLSHILDQHENFHAVVTANTHAARKMVQGWQDQRIHARLAPLDNVGSVRRFLNNWQPRAAFTLENELWPVRMIACQDRDIPVVVLGGRISAKSASNWHRLSRLANRIMGTISALTPLDPENGDRFAALGLAPEKIGAAGNLKTSVQLPPPDPVEYARLAKIFAHQDTILAASTHVGEDEIILRAFKTARAENPNLRLILAPRHPDRARAIAQMIKQYDLGFVRRSQGGQANAETLVYLADTTGEMAIWYMLASITFLGASLIEKGGHTPVEAVQFGSIVIHGPYVANHAQAYAALDEQKAAFSANTVAELAAYFTDLSKNPPTDIPQRANHVLATVAQKNADPAMLFAQLNVLTNGKLSTALLD